MKASSGLSPRVRGNQWDPGEPRTHDRSIPARAGEPRTRPGHYLATTVYPRACGGTLRNSSTGSTTIGLSPRVRGNLSMRGSSPSNMGSIPARAGEPTSFSSDVTTERVYPRACGGTIYRRGALPRRGGLSPRVRGNRGGDVAGAGLDRSIPARAGEPADGYDNRAMLRVYPRACGGTA